MANNNNGHQPNFYLTTLNDDNGENDEEDEEERPSMETLDRKIPNPFEVSVEIIFFADINSKLPLDVLQDPPSGQVKSPVDIGLECSALGS